MKRYTEKHLTALVSDRKAGMSIHELMEKYHMPKTSVWHHVKDLSVSPAYRKILRSRQGGSKIRKQKNIEKAYNEALDLLKDVDISHSAIAILASLYWAEGSKGSFVFTNTDEKMIRVFLKIMRDYLAVRNEEIQLLIRITESMGEQLCLKYWQSVTKLPTQNIRLNVNNKQNKSKTKYGICRMTMKKGSYRLKLIHAIIDELAVRVNGA